MALLRVEHISKSYPSAGGAPRIDILRDVELTVDTGEAVAVVGPSGSGKSTLLNIIGGLDKPDKGRVLLDGKSLSELTEAQLAKVRNRRIGFIFQLHHLLPQLTVLENVFLPALAFGAEPDAEERAVELLKRVGLGERLRYFPAQLSGGEQQRVAVVRALLNRPDLILADEPTGSLDSESAAALADLLVELNRDEETALIVVTHSSELAARMQRRFRLTNGRLIPA